MGGGHFSEELSIGRALVSAGGLAAPTPAANRDIMKTTIQIKGCASLVELPI
jgi:hypothetical protein